MVLSTNGDKPLDWLRAGQALQHALLTATRYGGHCGFFDQLRQNRFVSLFPVPRALRAQPAIFPGLDPDAIEQGRVVGHDRTVCAPVRDTFKT